MTVRLVPAASLSAYSGTSFSANYANPSATVRGVIVLADSGFRGFNAFPSQIEA